MKNKKNKKKIINDISENISVYSDSSSFHLNNSDYFLAISDLNVANGIDIVKNILIFSKEIEKKYNSINSAISSFKKDKKLNSTYIAQENLENIDYFVEYCDKILIINFLSTNLNLVNVTDNLQVNTCEKGFNSGKLDFGQIIIINDSLTPKELMKYYKVAIESRIKYFEYLNLPKHIKNILNNNGFLIVSSIIPKILIKEDNNNTSYIFNKSFEKVISKANHSIDKDIFEKIISLERSSINRDSFEKRPSIEKSPINIYENDNIEKDLVKTLIKTYDNCLKRANISFGILDYIIAEGVSIDALVDAGMELCVGVEDSKELRKKLKRQIFKSLEDLNVIALLMSAIRCEDDFQNNRVREVDVSDDPAYLYTDEVLGIAIANQIAGTKATFNFKRYDEEKPGIIAKLGPMVDDIFAGLVAGCMSKIFEDDY